MSQRQKQPKVEWGFYAMTPRIVRTQYKNLSHAEKWFYTCLKDLCGDDGTCFRTLRKLHEETDISIGSLTPMINHLHEAGLIHAEKKHRPKSTREVWHITIVDVWQANFKYCSNSEHSQCSTNEHSNEETSQCSNSEQAKGGNVQNSNIAPENLSSKCSNFVTRRTLKNKDTFEEDKITDVASAHAEHDAPSPFSLADEELIALLSSRGYQVMPSQQSSSDTQNIPPTSEQPAPESPLSIEASSNSYSPNSSDETSAEPSQQTLPDVAMPPDSAKPTEARATRKRAGKPASEKPAKEQKPKEPKHHPDLGKWYGMFNQTYRELGKKEGVPSNFALPSRTNYTQAFEDLIAAGVTLAQGKWLLTSIWNDPDPFWHDKRTPTAMASQYAVRIGRMPRNLRVEPPPTLEIPKPVEQQSPEVTSPEGQLASCWTHILTQKEFFQLDLDVRKDYKQWERAQQKKVS